MWIRALLAAMWTITYTGRVLHCTIDPLDIFCYLVKPVGFVMLTGRTEWSRWWSSDVPESFRDVNSPPSLLSESSHQERVPSAQIPRDIMMHTNTIRPLTPQYGVLRT
jgi:hypothetical protein